MLINPTLDRLRQLRLDAMAATYQDQWQHPDVQALGFDERLGLLVDAEWIARVYFVNRHPCPGFGAPTRMKNGRQRRVRGFYI